MIISEKAMHRSVLKIVNDQKRSDLRWFKFKLYPRALHDHSWEVDDKLMDVRRFLQRKARRGFHVLPTSTNCYISLKDTVDAKVDVALMIAFDVKQHSFSAPTFKTLALSLCAIPAAHTTILDE